MSEPIPESIPTSSDSRSKRPTKRRALGPSSQHANQVEALFANPDKEIVIPPLGNKPKSHLPPPPEIVPNIQGSSAGAGSGEFHVYKASRRREYERLRAMDDEVKEEKEREEYEKAREERKKNDDAKTSKNKARRDKAKERKKNKGKECKTQGGDGKTEAGTNGMKRLDPVVASGNRQGSGSESPEAKGEEIGVIIHDDD